MYFWILLVASCTFIIHIILDLCFLAVIFKSFRLFVLLNTLQIPLNTNVNDLLHLHYSYYLIYFFIFIFCSDFF